MRVLTAIFLVLLVFPSPASPRTWHVPSEAPTIQAGVDSAAYGDTVLVVCGTYYEHEITMKNGVILSSESGAPECVTVDAQSNGRGIYCYGCDSSSEILGLTITNGDSGDQYGGGISCNASSPIIKNCNIMNNYGIGAGLACYSGSDAEISFCVLDNNVGDNGGLYCLNSSPILTDCLFTANATVDGGAITCRDNSHPIITNCQFHENDGLNGGAIMLGDGSLTLSGCTFTNNRCSDKGGAIVIGSGAAEIRNCLFYSNITVVEGRGGAICVWTESSLSLYDSSIIGNTSSEYGGGIYVKEGAALEADNVDMSDNVAPFGAEGWVAESGSASLICCDLNENDWGGLGTIIFDNSGCGPISRASITWGAVKALYR